MTKIIFFPIENYNREVDARLAIIKLILKKNSCEKYLFLILPKNLLPLILRFSQFRCTIFHKSLQKDFIPFITRKIKKGSKVTFIEEEYFDRYSDNDTRFGDGSNIISSAFASTLKDYNSLSKRLGKEKVKFTGNPRIDILMNIEKIYFKDISKIRKSYGKFALFNSNFSYANPPKGLDLNDLQKLYFANDKKGFNQLSEFISKHKKRFIKVKSFLIESNLLNSYDTIIYRCHPNESRAKAKKEFKGSRVVVLSDDNVLFWIFASSILIHACCSTSIEAYIMKKRSMIFEPFKEEENSLSYKTSSEIIYSNRITPNPNYIDQEARPDHPIYSQLPKLEKGQITPKEFPASTSIASWIIDNSPATSILIFIPQVFIGLLISLPRIILTFLIEKERARINIDLKKSIRNFRLKYIWSSNFLGIGIIK